MSGFELPTKVQLTESVNAVERVLEALRNHTNFTLNHHSRIFPPVKELYKSLQALEDDEAKTNGAFNTADVRERHNLTGVLASCGVVAGQLRQRINSNAIRRDDRLGIDLMTLTNEIKEFMKLRKKQPATTARPTPGTTSDSSALVEDLLRKQQEHDSEVEALEVELHKLYRNENVYEQEIDSLKAELTAKNQLINVLEDHNEAKLSHIRRLHAATFNLGLRHPMTHRTHDWDGLTDELPTMVQRIEYINMKLKELELERDRLEDQEHEFEDDILLSAPAPTSAVKGSKLSTGEKAKDKDGDGKNKRKEHRNSTESKPSSKVRSPSPTSSEASKANTSKSVRRKGRNANGGSGFFFGN